MPSERVAHSKAAAYPTLRIAHLFSSLLNVAGDSGNVTAVQRRAGWRGIGADVVPVETGQAADLTTFDLIFVQGGQDIEMAVAADDLRLRASNLRDAADAGVVIFAVCAGLQLLGHRYVPRTGAEIVGIGLFDLETRAGDERFMQHAACQVGFGDQPETIVGFENHSGLTELGPGVRPFGMVIAGAGNNGRDGTEGARRDNVYGTYLHGPVLPKNPWLADYLVRVALERKTGGAVHLRELDDELERNAHALALEEALRNRGRRTALEPAKLGRA
jgi:hypothetical protein